MIFWEGESCAVADLSQSYAVRSIVAVEAKMSKWRSALDQARLNTWFASESYVLLPAIPGSKDFVALAGAAEVGVIIRDRGVPEGLGTTVTATPLSYASWAFNQWIWEVAVNGH
jgi:hypothetical protein